MVGMLKNLTREKKCKKSENTTERGSRPLIRVATIFLACLGLYPQVSKTPKLHIGKTLQFQKYLLMLLFSSTRLSRLCLWGVV